MPILLTKQTPAKAYARTQLDNESAAPLRTATEDLLPREGPTAVSGADQHEG
jgi:hypothetical protein